MTIQQRTAIERTCRLAVETMHPRFRERNGITTVVLTVNTGYEWIEADFGGPVWHTSVSGFGLSIDTLRAKALRVLDGVGDPLLGQWEEIGIKAFHLRRRLTEDETKKVGGVLDVRGTPEAQQRFDRMRQYLPPGWTDIQ